MFILHNFIRKLFNMSTDKLNSKPCNPTIIFYSSDSNQMTLLFNFKLIILTSFYKISVFFRVFTINIYIKFSITIWRGVNRSY